MSIIYNPNALISNESGTRNTIISKHCAASVKEDACDQLISNTIIAALKQGLTNTTHLTALCDGADNCWKIVDALKPLSGSTTCILDWFHIAKKIENIALSGEDKEKLTLIKWHLWRGNVERAQIRLTQLIEKVESSYKDRLQKFLNYIINNQTKVVDYRSRKKEGLVFTSQLAESTVESLINQRCKRQQHMRWSREGLNPFFS